MLKNGLKEIESAYALVWRLKFLVVAWFVRLAWLPALLWGCVDLIILWTQPLSAAQADGKLNDAAIRITGGLLLFLIWFFMLRRRGSWTMNKGGKLEK